MPVTMVTCHECREVNQAFTIEWPPKIVICNNCGQVFKFTQDSPSGGAHFQIVPHRL